MDKSNIRSVFLVLAILSIFLGGFAIGSSQSINVSINGNVDVASENASVVHTTVQPTVTVQPQTTQPVVQPTTQSIPATESLGTTVPVTQQATDGGLNSTDINEVLSFYKKVADTNPTLVGQNQMSIGDITGEGATTSAIKMVKPMIDKMVAEPYEHTTFPGTPSLLTADDIVSASAVSDGMYTTVSLVIRDQPGAESMQAEDGPVGHAMGIIGDIASKVTDVIKFKDGGSMTLTYSGCKITIKADNSSYKLVDGKWENTGLIEITDASVLGILSVKKANCPLITVISTL